MTRKSLILVVDDERQIQRFLSPSLKMEGYEVALASNAAEALESVAREHPALVVLDLGLPDRDGKSVIAELRNKHTIPIIVLSARDDEACGNEGNGAERHDGECETAGLERAGIGEVNHARA